MASLLPDSGAILLLGGRSEIGLETVARLGQGRTVVLAQRPRKSAIDGAQFLQQHGITDVYEVDWDAFNSDDLRTVYRHAEHLAGTHISTVVVAFGVLGDQEKAEHDPDEAFRIAETNYTSQLVTITAATEYLRERGEGLLVAFSSIAGWRVRRGNYVYGSTKAGLDGFLSGLIDATHDSPINVVMARPGFVIGRMTEGMDSTIMSSTAAQVAEAVVKAIHKGKHRVWIPHRLALLAAIMPFVPKFIWRRLPR